MFMENTEKSDEWNPYASAKYSSAHNIQAVKRKMVEGCRPLFSSKASYQPAGRQSISLSAPSFLCRLLVPSASENVDSCQSQKWSMRTTHSEGSHNTPTVAQGSVNDWRCWVRVSDMRPVGGFSHPATAVLPRPVCSCAHLQSGFVVSLWSFFPSLPIGFSMRICMASCSDR